MKRVSQVLGRATSGLKSSNVETATVRVVPHETQIPIVRVKAQPRRHKVLSFGYIVNDEEGKVADGYQFQYPPDVHEPENLHPGVIPAEYTACVPADDSWIYFSTQEGIAGPNYRVAYMTESNILLDWTEDVDGLWIEVLQTLEDGLQGGFALSEEALNSLDADPLFLFGIADPGTQAALRKTAVVPMLRCAGSRPCLEEWFLYLNADLERDAEYTWVVQSFSEVELPAPWTSFKGAGSIVCYLNNDTEETTWKHPFYDYFAQLLDHCRRATREEHVKLRINRMLWSYEAEAEADISNQQPLISPKFVKAMADTLSVDVITEPHLVRTLKTFLKAFSQQYRIEEELDTQEIKWCIEILENERAKFEIMRNMDSVEDPSDDIRPGIHRQVYCTGSMERCGSVASCYCPQCGDCFCEECFEKLHAKGNRSQHEANNIIPCVLCQTMPAKLQCTYTFGSYCQQCYVQKHCKALPKYLDLKPLRIDYTKVQKEPVVPGKRVWAIGETDPEEEAEGGFSHRPLIETLMGEKWHAFYDLRGVKYYYNFETEESVRRPGGSALPSDSGSSTTASSRTTSPSRSPMRSSRSSGTSPQKPKSEMDLVLRQLVASKEPRKMGDIWGRGVGPQTPDRFSRRFH